MSSSNAIDLDDADEHVGSRLIDIQSKVSAIKAKRKAEEKRASVKGEAPAGNDGASSEGASESGSNTAQQDGRKSEATAGSEADLVGPPGEEPTAGSGAGSGKGESRRGTRKKKLEVLVHRTQKPPRKSMTLKPLLQHTEMFDSLWHRLKDLGDTREKQQLCDEALELLFNRYHEVLN